jgi:PIN domain nuclease of toxin-antitoxin system
MKLLLDTHISIWAVAETQRLSSMARGYLEDPQNEIFFSVINVWEATIKHGLGRKGFPYEPRKFRRGLLESGFKEIEISSEHVLAVSQLPSLHRDPFDRLLIAQASFESLVLLTSDAVVARYPGAIRLV